MVSKAEFKKTIARCGLEALHRIGAPAILRPFVGGVGVIAMLHRVQPASADKLAPNQSLEITPDFLEKVIRRLQRSHIDFLSLDEMHRRLTERDFRRRFVVLTFDDGYRDNKDWAYPILRSFGVPFAIYVATSFPNRRGQLYWVALESIVRANDSVVFEIGAMTHRLPASTLRQKRETFRTISRLLQTSSSEPEARKTVHDLTRRYGIDMLALCSELCMTWSEIALLAADPLVTIGAHTINHPSLPRNSEAIVRSELRGARAELEAALGREVRHLAYPFGAAGPREFELAAEAGYATAVTTRPSVLFSHDRDAPLNLPRIAIDGNFQREHYVDVLASGAGTALWTALSQIARWRA